MEACSCCGQSQPPDSFYARHQVAECYFGMCKACVRFRSEGLRTPVDVEERRRKRRKRYYEHPERKRASAYDPKKAAANRDAWVAKNPQKRAAFVAVAYALRTGKLKKQPCGKCGARKVYAQHADYSKKLEVTWACPKCAGLLRRKGA